MTNVIAVIPARGGSLRFPGKNVVPVGGKPLIAHSIEAARACPELSRVIVSTDDDAIARTAVEYGAEVIPRPVALALSDSAIDDAYRHVLEEVCRKQDVDIVVGMQANMPVRKPGEISELLDITRQSPWATAVATAKRVTQRPEWMKRLVRGDSYEVGPYTDPTEKYRKQDFEDLFLLDGASMALRPEVLRKSASDRRVHAYLGPRVRVLVHDDRYSIEIDEPEDLQFAEFFLRRAHGD